MTKQPPINGNSIPSRWLEEHNRRAAEHIAQCKIEAFIRKELGDEEN